MKPQRYRIGELAETAQVSKRTVHYYIARGLLPSPEGSGLGTFYSDEHLFRIQLIRRWQDQYLPLEEIKSRILPLSLAEVKDWLARNEAIQPLPSPQKPTHHLQGRSYQRIMLGNDLEIHFSPDNPKAKKMAEEILVWVTNQQKEG